MTYQDWVDAQAIIHKEVMSRLTHLKDDEVIEYFDFENMVKNEPDFCPLYKTNTKCHDIENLNCYLCACPHFKVQETQSICSINCKDGSSMTAPDGYVHQDCSNCYIPHKKEYVKNYFNRDWKAIFTDCIEADK
jgi:Zn-finger protein